MHWRHIPIKISILHRRSCLLLHNTTNLMVTNSFLISPNMVRFLLTSSFLHAPILMQRIHTIFILQLGYFSHLHQVTFTKRISQANMGSDYTRLMRIHRYLTPKVRYINSLNRVIIITIIMETSITTSTIITCT